MKELFRAVNEAWYEQYGTVNADVRRFCFDSGFWSWEDTVDAEGNIVDSEKIITRKDLQECCDAVGIDFNCLSF